MTGRQIVFISHFAVKAGHADAFRELWNSTAAELEASRPATAAFLAYLDEAGDRLTIVHVFPDAESFAAHAEGSGERSRVAFDHVTPAGWEIYGRAPAAIVDELRHSAERFGVELVIQPESLGGFLRTAGR
jgi:hypothetical protein